MKNLYSLLFIFLFLINFTGANSFAQCPCTNNPCDDSMACPNKKAPCSNVNSTDNYYIIYKGNVFKVAFECKFRSECVNEGDDIYFYVPKDIYSSCGSLILPMGTKLIGHIRGVTSQKILNKNARVYISINKLLMPDNTQIDIKAKPFTKDFSLVENGWMTAGKLAASTVGLGIIGTGTGVGLAFIPTPQKIAVGAAAIGLPVGCFIGLVTGLVTPGLKYHAKRGEEIYVILCDDLYIPKSSIKEF